MPTRIGINGFGRIGRSVFRQWLELNDKNLEIVAINDLAASPVLAHLLKYDSVHGTLSSEIRAEEDSNRVDSRQIPVFKWKSPAESAWGKLGVDIVLECSGVFTTREACAGHLQAGAKKVLISAPAKGADLTLVIGVNSAAYDPQKHDLVSNASCTTNCLAPLVKVIHDEFRFLRGFMTTVHSYTNDQKILDVAHKDLRRARAAALSQIPTTTGAAQAIGLVIPELKGKIDGLAVRVPTPNVSLVDLVCVIEKKASRDSVNQALKTASDGALKGILAYCEEPLVSVDFNGNPHSSTVDSLSTAVIDDTLVKVVSWYDNETGFSRRMIDAAKLIASHF